MYKAPRKNITPIALAAALLCGAGAASAGEPIEFGDGYKFDWRVNTNYTLSQRVKSQDPILAGSAASNLGQFLRDSSRPRAPSQPEMAAI